MKIIVTISPVDATMALAKGARLKGVKIVEGAAVTGVTTWNGRATGVTTAEGNSEAEFVVNCAGMWARQLGALNGIGIPNQPTEHYYLITEPIEGMTRQLPIIEDPSCHGYYREEVGGLMIGLFEPVCAPWKVNGVPDDFSFGEIPPDWDRMTPFLETGLGFAVDLDKPDFIGKAYCVEKKARGPAYNRRLLQVLVKDPKPLLYHAEVIYRNNKAVGYIRAASYGFTLGGAVGLAMIEAGEPIDRAYLKEGAWEVDIAGKRHPADVSLRPMYDPETERIKA